MTKAKKRLLFSVAALVIAIAVATGSTFAWFTINREVNVEQMDISVTAGSQGIYIATAKAGPYKTALNAADLAAAGYKADASLDAVTSTDGKVIKDLDGNTIGADSKKFIEMKFYFRATGETVPTIDLKRTNNTEISGRNTILQPHATNNAQTVFNTWKDIAADDFGQTNAIALNAPVPVRAAHATRVSFDAVAHDTTTVSTRVWDPYYGDPATFRGKENPDNAGKFDNAVGNFALAYYNATKADDDANLTWPTTGIAQTEAKDDFFSDVLKLTPTNMPNTYEGELTIRIWLEGWDGDCMTSILGDKIVADFVFAIRDVAPKN